MAGLASTGRGGAGNISDASKSPQLTPQDLDTPTLKTSIVTTGRGGSGNMAKNTDPEETRARQDVGPVTRRLSHGATHVGRGGAANVSKTGDLSEHEEAVDDKQPQGLAARAKDFLFGKK